MKPRIRLISMGGTISSSTNHELLASPSYSGEDILRLVPNIDEYACIEVEDFSKILSSQLTIEQIYNLSKRIDSIFKKEKDTVGIVVTHGTGTIEESAFMTDLIVNDKRPVIFTGAMRNMSSPFTDGPFNVLNAVRVAINSNSLNKGVMIALNEIIHSARDVYKSHTTNVNAFNSGEFGPIGYIYPDRIHFAKSSLLQPKIYSDTPEFNVDLIKFFVGMNDKFIQASIDSNAKGIVIEGSGLGNVNNSLADGIRFARQNNVSVVISSRCPEGRVFPSYSTKSGANALQKMGCILTSLPGPKARIMLMLALGNSLTNEEMIELFDPSNLYKQG